MKNKLVLLILFSCNSFAMMCNILRSTMVKRGVRYYCDKQIFEQNRQEVTQLCKHISRTNRFKKNIIKKLQNAKDHDDLVEALKKLESHHRNNVNRDNKKIAYLLGKLHIEVDYLRDFFK